MRGTVAQLTPLAPPRRRRRVVFAVALAFALPWVVSLVRPATAGAAACDPFVSNPVACENSKPGNPQDEWDAPLDPSPSIEGFATDISVDHGQTVHFKVRTSALAYRIDIYRLGYYGGMGARKVATVNPSALLPQMQPGCAQDSATHLVDCGNWGESASWAVPADAVSGVYLARLVRLDTGEPNHIFFIVRDDEGHSNLLFKTSDATWQAYNGWGGANLYNGTSGRAYKVSYNRPFDTRVGGNGRSFFFASEYPMARFLERNGYDVSYFTSVDAARYGSKILDHKVLLSVGHDEYWSAAERANVTAARGAGVNLAFFSGNEVFWKTRWEPSIDGSSTAYRTLVCYKETLAGAKIDPSPTWTGTWRDPRFSPPSDGGQPENALSGQLFQVNADREDPMYVPAQYGKLRFWRNTNIANLAPGQTATLPTGVLGYEWDEDKDNGLRPSGEFDMSSSTYAVSTYLYLYGADYGNGTATHHLTMYRANSGALVFGAGTVQWSFGLDATHDYGGTPTDSRMQQATVNLLADMSAQPVTLDPALAPATKSTDATPPTSTITSPAPNTNLSPGTVTITGTASDAGGGVVAGVEVSTDGGEIWHPATGTTNWSYAWSQGITTTTIKSRAVDDSGNIETPSAGVPVTVGQTSCPCSIWGPSATPVTADSGDTGSYELGVRFRSDVDGFATGIRFYKASQNTGTHVGRLWTNSGTLLSSATFTNESGSGWQQVSFSSPVAVSANTTYVASYSDPNGHFSVDRPAFATAGVDNPPLHGLQDGVDGPNGVYATGPGFYPTSSVGSSNYWVDVVFDRQSGSDTTPPTITTIAPPSSATGVPTGTTVTAQFSEGMNAATITGATIQLRDGSDTLVPATVSYVSSTNTATLTPNAPLASSTTYTATIVGGSSGVKDAAGNALAADYISSFSTGAPGVCPCSIWSTAATPPTVDSGDAGSYELGVRFRPDSAGYITGIRFYKALQNTGTHVGRLWSNTGTLLASAAFTSESGSGWQQVTFANPVAVSASTTYVASYSDPNGHFSLARPAFANSGVDNPPLHALKDGLDGPNGVFSAGPGTFPASSSSSSNYWVDVVFNQTDTTPPTVTSVSPTPGATGVAAGTAVTAQFSKTLDPSSLTAATFELKDASNTVVAATVTYNGANSTATLTPNAPLSTGAAYTATVKGGSSGVKDTAGNALAADYVWSFSTGSPGACPCSIWSSTATPATVDSGDTSSYELGVRFRSDSAGYITGIRFYKALQNTGTHVGRLWSNTGTLLASAAFTSESGSGWQQVTFSNPVAVNANTTYVASYSDPNGHFSIDRPAFANAGVDNPPLHALKNGLDGANGVYGEGAGFYPTSSSSSSNYWVDVVFNQTDNVPASVTSVSPTAGATAVAPSTAVTAQFSKPLDATTVTGSNFQLKDASNAVVNATVTASGSTATLQPASSLSPSTTYTATLKGGSGGVADSHGNPLPADFVWSFTTAGPATCPCSIWSSAATPAAVDSDDTASYELGVRFRSDLDGWVTGIRFYKGAQNTGTHVGRLWTNGGTLLASATFTGETGNGWQQVSFSTPVPVTANTTYVASYSDPSGHYSVDGSAFATAGVDGLPLHALKDGLDGANGIYADGAGFFPTNSVNSSNYWVDVVFDNHDTTPPNVSSVTPAGGSVGVAPGTTVTAQFNEPMSQPSVSATTFQLKDATDAVIPASVSFNATTRTAVLTPNAPLAASKTYTATVKGGGGGVTDTSGNALAADYSWSYSVGCPCSIWSPAATPATVDSGDTGAYELGVRFRSDIGGYVTGVRFYKGALNTGTHVGRLWMNTGTLLASATFSGETASGWQQVTFSNPVPLTANTTYVASYADPSGHYSLNRPAFATAGVDSPPLHALKDGLDGANGVFANGVGLFPTRSVSSSNYWVDVAFRPYSDDTAPPTSATSFPAATGTYGSASWSTGCATAGFCGTASDADSGVKKVELSIQQGSGNYWNGTSFSSTTEVFNTATLSGSNWAYAFVGASFPVAGPYTVSVRATDNAGNLQTAASRTFTYDGIAPSSATTFPVAAGNYNAAGWGAGCSPAGICGTASDVGSGVQKAEISIRQGSGSYWNGTGFSSGAEVFNAATLSGLSWSYAFAATSFPTNTTYTVRVRTTDAAGNAAIASSLTFRYDTSLPSATYAFPASGASYNSTGWNAGCATPGLCGSDSDSGSGVQKVELSLRQGTGNYWNGATFASATEVFLPATLTGSTWSFPFGAANLPAEGSYTARLRATDKAGNAQAPASRSFTYDLTAPLVTATSPVAGATGVSVSANSTVTFNEPMVAASFTTTTFVLRDPAGNLVTANISYNSGQRRATLSPPATLAPLTVYTATVSGGPGGVTDAAGNPLAASYSWSFRTR